MQLASDWKEIAKRAWSMRLMYLLAAFGAMEAALPFIIEGFEIPSKVSGFLTLGVTAAAMLSRLVYQRGISKPKAAATEEDHWI